MGERSLKLGVRKARKKKKGFRSRMKSTGSGGEHETLRANNSGSSRKGGEKGEQAEGRI